MKLFFAFVLLAASSHAAHIRGFASPGESCKGRDKASMKADMHLWCKCSRKHGLIKEDHKERCADEPERKGKCKFEGGVCVPATTVASAGEGGKGGKGQPASASGSGQKCCMAPGMKAELMNKCRAQFKEVDASKCDGGGAPKGQKAGPATTAAPGAAKPLAAGATGAIAFPGTTEKPGTTCKEKKPVLNAPVTKETNLDTLQKGCAAKANEQNKQMYVIYAKESNEKQSNCWLCDGTEVRDSKMKKAALYKIESPLAE